jgi:hypothetical protein
MKNYTIALLLALGFTQFAFAPQAPSEGLRSVSNNAFRVGEYLKYRVHYGFIDAGYAELRVKEMVTRNGRPTFHMVGTGRTTGMAEWFFKTRDRYETFIDQQSILPWEFIRDVNEGGYIIKRHLIFDHFQNTVKDLEQNGKQYDLPKLSQDMLSSFYYARTFDQNTLRVGDKLPITMFLDHEEFPFFLKYLGKETLSTKWGNVRCLKFSPVVQEGRVFKDEEGMTLWVSDDENKVPIRLQTDLQIGSVKMDLEEYSGLIRPLAFKK